MAILVLGTGARALPIPEFASVAEFVRFSATLRTMPEESLRLIAERSKSLPKELTPFAVCYGARFDV
jgi:hypothetical protein